VRTFPAALLLLLVGLTGCSDNPDRGAVEAGMAGSLTRAIFEHRYPLVMTQAEFQEGARGLWWVTQYQDPVQTPAVSSYDTELLLFQAPLEALVEAVRDHESDLRDLGTDVFIIAFRGDSTVYEVSAELMWEYADGDVTWVDVRDQMLISA